MKFGPFAVLRLTFLPLRTARLRHIIDPMTVSLSVTLPGSSGDSTHETEPIDGSGAAEPTSPTYAQARGRVDLKVQVRERAGETAVPRSQGLITGMRLGAGFW